MKRDKIIYWISTGLVSAGMLMSAFMYLSKNEEFVKNLETIGIAYYFFVFLGVAKALGAIALLAPVHPRIKEWAYAGFTFTFLGATWTHIATNTPWIAPLVFQAILIASYLTWLRLQQREPVHA